MENRVDPSGPFLEATRLCWEAQRLQRDGDFEAAAGNLQRAYDLQPTIQRACGVVRCLRRLSPAAARQAADFAAEALAIWPQDEHLGRERVWALYAGYLKATNDTLETVEFDSPEGAYHRMLEVLNQILDLTAETLPRTMAVFAVCKEAKRRGRWDDILSLVDILDPQKLGSEQRNFQGRGLPAELERWYLLKVRALFEVGKFSESEELAREAISIYSRSSHLHRLVALGRLAVGQTSEAYDLLLDLTKRFPRQWYALWDLGKAASTLGRHEEALKWLLAGARERGDFKVRIGLFEEIAQHFAKRGDHDGAEAHLQLALAIARTEG